MTRIKKYKITPVTSEDIILGTQAISGKTVNYSIEDIIDLVETEAPETVIDEIDFKGSALPVTNKTVTLPNKLSEFDNDLDIIDGAQVDEKIVSWSIRNVNTIQDLRNTVGVEGQKVNLLGYYEAGDKPSLIYKFVVGQGEDDGGSVINTLNGRWEAEFVDSSIPIYTYGEDFQKVFTYASINRLGVNINKDVEINTVINLDRTPTYSRIYKMIIKGPSRVKSSLPYIFSSDADNQGDFSFENITFSTPNYVINGDKIIRFSFFNNHVVGGGGIVEAKNKWLQSVRIFNNTILEAKIPTIYFCHAFDITINDNISELGQEGGSFIESNDEPKTFENVVFNGRIFNNCLEGLKNTPIILGRTFALSIYNNYLEYNELNPSYLSEIYLDKQNFSNNTHEGLSVYSNGGDCLDKYKNTTYGMIKIEKNFGKDTKIENNTYSGQLMSIEITDVKKQFKVKHGINDRLSFVNKISVVNVSNNLVNSKNLYKGEDVINNLVILEIELPEKYKGANYSLSFETNVDKINIFDASDSEFSSNLSLTSSLYDLGKTFVIEGIIFKSKSENSKTVKIAISSTGLEMKNIVFKLGEAEI